MSEPRDGICVPRWCGKCRRVRRATVFLVAAMLLLGIVWFFKAYQWLAPRTPVPAKYLVVEGWLPDYAMEAAAREYRRGQYERLFTTGGPLERGSYLQEYRTYAELGRATLLRLGLSTNEVTAVPSERQQRNRTFASAVALGDHCRRLGIPLTDINLMSVGPHTRRSGLCFRRALGQGVRVGLIAIDTQDYEVERWWKSSQGVKDIVGETLSVAYAWLTIDFGP